MLLKYSLLFSLVLVFLLLFFSFGGIAKPVKPQPKSVASYEKGRTVIVQTVSVGPDGGAFKVDIPGSPIDGVTISAPLGTFEKESTISLGYNDGRVSPASGKWSGVILVVEAVNIVSFGKPIAISVRFDPAIQPQVVTGFEIDDAGSLHALDFAGIDKRIGSVSFYVFKPLMLTWVYIM